MRGYTLYTDHNSYYIEDPCGITVYESTDFWSAYDELVRLQQGHN